jgi:FixJ family two-component response regulator
MKQESDFRAFMISAHEDEWARTQALEAGAIEFFLKLFNNHQLKEMVFQALGLSRS